MFWQSWLSKDMSNLGFNPDYLGYVIGSQSFVYLVGCLLLPYTCESSPRKLQFVLSILGFGFSCFLMGPSAVLDLP